MYVVKEAFFTLQGEGRHAGRPAVFCRFAGCNLWSGREKDRAGAICQICDTDFVGGVRWSSAEALAGELRQLWPGAGQPYVVLTGGEPLLQVDDDLVLELSHVGFEIGIETNGTIRAPSTRVDWICVSPKVPAAQLVQRAGDELKLLYPTFDPVSFEQLSFTRYSLQPLDDATSHVQETIDYCMRNPRWELSLQTHKITGVR